MKKIVILLTCLVAASCSSVRKNEGDLSHSVYITDELQVTLISLAKVSENRELYQEIAGRYGIKNYNIQAYLLMNSDEISITAYTPFGNTVFDLQYTDNEIRYKGLIDSKSFNPCYLIADFQLCYFSSNSIEAMLQSTGLMLSTKIMEDGWNRRIYDGSELIIEITRRKNTIIFNNYLRDYSYNIEEYPA